MITTSRTLLTCLVLHLAVTQTIPNPWHQNIPNPWHLHLPAPLQTSPNLKHLLQHLTPNLTNLLSNFKFHGFGNATSCTAKLTELAMGVTSQNMESIAFLDALGKPGAGVTTGNFLLLGDYDMCESGILGNLSTVYRSCAVTGTMSLAGYPLPIEWTGCSPPECQNTADLEGVFVELSKYINMSGFIHTDPASWSAVCDSEQEFDAGAYAAVTIIAIFAFLVVVGTVWYLLEPIVISFLDRDKEDTSTLVENEEIENPYEDVDKKGGEPSKEHKTPSQADSLIGRFFKCFALQRTMETLFSMTTKPGQVLCLNGIRVLSINWVVLGHAYLFSMSYTGGFSYAGELTKRRNFMIVYNGLPSVDSFFTLSGFLVTYLLLKQLAKRGGLTPPQWAAFYLHRYLRLTAPYLVAMLLEGWLYRLVMSGPRALQTVTGPTSAHHFCEKWWYTNLLYINNLVPWKDRGEACLGQGWYLANDMQFFILAPLFIVLLYRKPLTGVLVTAGVIVCSAVTSAVITDHYNLGPATVADGNQDEFWLMYNKPWIRITPYLVGIMGGWFYWKWGEGTTAGVKTLPDWLKVMCAAPLWAVTAALQYAVVFGLYGDLQDLTQQHKQPNKADSISYQSLARIAWSLSLTIQVLLCQSGLGGFINSLLSWKGWLILSRLTYSVFLLHIGLLTVVFGQLRHAFHLNPDFEFAVFYLGMLAISYLSAAVLYLSVEQPAANLESITYRKNKYQAS